MSGIIGSGREHLAPLLFGALPRTGGDVAVGGGALPAANPGAPIRAGMALRARRPPRRRRRDDDDASGRTCTLPDLRRLRGRGGQIDLAAERREAGEWLRRVELRPADPERPLELFSGGNQQKVVLAKWLRNKPRVLLLDEPTQGVDVGAKAAIYDLIARCRPTRARPSLMASSDTEELACRLRSRRRHARRRVVRGGRRAGADRGAPRGLRTAPRRHRRRRLRAMTDVAMRVTAAPAAEAPPRDAVVSRNISALYVFAALFVLFALWVPDTFLTAGRRGGRCWPTRR